MREANILLAFTRGWRQFQTYNQVALSILLQKLILSLTKKGYPTLLQVGVALESQKTYDLVELLFFC